MSERRLAILIGNSIFSDDSQLADLRYPEADVDGMTDLLSAPEFGEFSQVVACKNWNHPDLLRQIGDMFRGASKNDLVLLYYSGHGRLDRVGSLYLATSDTNVDNLIATAIPVDRIRSFIENSNCERVILIFDCCYSGAAAVAFVRGEADLGRQVEDQLQRVAREAKRGEGRGIYILTASTSLQVAEEKEGDGFGLLTKHIIKGIREGNAANDIGLVSMESLYSYVANQIPAEGTQEPMRWAVNVRGDNLFVSKTKYYSPEDQSKRIKNRLRALQSALPTKVFDLALKLAELDITCCTENERAHYDLLDRLASQDITIREFLDLWILEDISNNVMPESSRMGSASDSSAASIFTSIVSPNAPPDSAVAALAEVILAESDDFVAAYDNRQEESIMNPAFTLSKRFLTLPLHKRIRIARKLGIFEEQDRALQADELSLLIFSRAARQQLLGRLWDELEDMQGGEHPGTNPFLIG